MPAAKFTFIDLFAGIGGMRIAAQKLGGHCVFSSEIDPHCQLTYLANFGDMPHGDIAEVSARDIPKHDLLMAGFPCQPFSHAGHRKGFSDTRGTLFFEIARILDARKPRALLLENVKGLRSHDSGRTLQRIEDVLEELGYVVSSKVLNARDFGLPQNRQRLVIVGLRGTLANKMPFSWPQQGKRDTQVRTILSKRVPEKYTISDRLWAGHQLRREIHGRRGNGWGYSLVTRDSEYTSTLSARYYKDGAEILIEQPNKNPRMLTPEEASRLQGFPPDFKIVVSDAQAYRQFGNAVPVPMIAAVVKQIRKYLI